MPDMQYVEQERYKTAREMPPPERTPTPRTERTVAEAVGTGSALQLLAGAAGVVLTIIALSTTGAVTFYTTAIAAIVLGVGLMSYGAGLATGFAEAMIGALPTREQEVEVGGGVSAEVLGGIAGLTLGILALVGVASSILLSVIPIVFGGTLLLGSGAVAETNRLRLQRAFGTQQVTRQGTLGAAGIQILAGVAAVVLGILAVIGTQPGLLSVIGILCIVRRFAA